MLRNEYIRFMQTLNTNEVTDNVRKLANIILEHLDELIPLGTTQSRRSKKLIELAQKKIKMANAKCIAELESAQTGINKVTRLKLLKVGPFRGFAKEEIFDLDSPIVLLYGPNGTGKSSFCEALEYGLLGSVGEVESKRFTKPADYLKNAHVNRFKPPIIEAATSSSSTEPCVINANEVQFRFCFVEKNRIDNFSRIAAHTPARQTELISALFGLESFNEFVRDFSPSLDPKYIDLVGQKATELGIKRAALEGNKQAITTNTLELEKLATEEQILADSYQENMPFIDFVLSLGTNEHPGEIQRLEAELQRPALTLFGLNLADLTQTRINLEAIITSLQEKELELAECREGFSYKQLYEAVIALKSANEENCPACKTSLSQTIENPFQCAERGLAQLEHLSVLEQQHDTLIRMRQEALKAIHDKFIKACLPLIGDGDQLNPLQSYLVTTDSQLDGAWWQRLTQINAQNQSDWFILEQQIQQLEQYDVVESQKSMLYETQRKQLQGLRTLSEQAIALKERRKILENAVSSASKIIAEFDEKNKALIAAIEQERDIVINNVQISEAYLQLVELLTNYKEALPGKLVADLGVRVVELYNAFNRFDASHDLLANLRLPMTSGERIQIAFKNNPEVYFDALHILSEGHIRCVGLAILLAKNLEEDCSILVFDDPVNAIDDEHREAIRLTLFEDNFFSEKQIILTCHGEEFCKDVQNLLGSDRSKSAKRFTFLPQLDDKHIQFDSQSNPRNYVLAAQEYIKKSEVRESLAASRRALEVLTKKTWKYVSKHGDGNLSVKLRSPSATIELRNLTEQLKMKLSHEDFTHSNKQAVLGPLNTLLGRDGDSREWRYLNKGTHEENDRTEFDTIVVGEIINALTSLDDALLST